MRALHALALAPAIAACIGACKDQDVSEHPAFVEAANADGERDRSNIVKVQTPVPVGEQVACEDLLDPSALTAMLEEDEPVTLDDRSHKSAEATSVCGIVRGGEPPSSAAQKRQFERTARLGVLPGDELCTIEAYCSYPNTIDELVRSCEREGDEVNEDLGRPACVHRTQRGPKFAFTYKVYDPETRCTFRVLGGPSVTDEALVQSCTTAALDSITSENLVDHE